AARGAGDAAPTPQPGRPAPAAEADHPAEPPAGASGGAPARSGDSPREDPPREDRPAESREPAGFAPASPAPFAEAVERRNVPELESFAERAERDAGQPSG